MRSPLVREMILLRALCVLFTLCATAAWAQGTAEGESVVVLVNSASEASEAVGAHYARKRGVPDSNICRITCTTAEAISRKRFDAQIRGPLRQFLLKRGLAREAKSGGLAALKVRYLVSAYGVPVKIREVYSEGRLEQRRKGLEKERKGTPKWHRQRNAASVDSELSVIARPGYVTSGWVRNPMHESRPGAAYPLLFATRLDGPTPEIAKGLVDAALYAEEHGLFGVAYIDARGLKKGSRYRKGDEWLLAARDALKAAGCFTRVDDRSDETFHPDMPMPNAAFYFGWYEPHLCGPMAKKGFRFTRGAVAYHLHSGSAARLRKERIGWAGPLLSKGAAATMGAVFEPYLSQTPDVGEFTRQFLSGKTFGESAYAATGYLSWMMTYVGDPLYAPFRADRRKAALARKENRFWRDMHDAVTAAGKGSPERALDICSKHATAALFVELAARVRFRSGEAEESMKLYRKLAGMVKDDYSSVQAYAVIGDWLVRAGARPSAERLKRAMDTYAECVRAHPKSPHALLMYRKALRLARVLRLPKAETELWERLAANFSHRAIGRFAAGELWVRKLRRKSPLPSLEVPRTEERPAIDARPGDLAWKKAAAIEKLPFRLGPRHVSRRVRIRLCYNLYALFVLAEISLPARRIEVSDEAFELTLSPLRDAERAVRISVPRHGKSPPGLSLKGARICVRTVQAKEGKRRREIDWVAEIEIPFAALGLRRAPKDVSWSANVVHRCTVPRFPFKRATLFRSWAKADADPLEPACAGYLVFR